MTPRESGEASLCREGTEGVVREGVRMGTPLRTDPSRGQEKRDRNLESPAPRVLRANLEMCKCPKEVTTLLYRAF